MYIPFPVLYGLLIVALFKTFAGLQVNTFSIVICFGAIGVPQYEQPGYLYSHYIYNTSLLSEFLMVHSLY